MHCPRLDHFARINHNGKIGKCGHMTGAKEFDSFDDMQDSKWLRDIKEKMNSNQWPAECMRCRMTEEATNTSIRLDMIERDRILRAVKKDYLIIGGVLDNICNSACQTCHSGLSTKIGSLSSKNYEKVNNYEKFFTFPQDRICEVDVNGGEPSASPNYKKLLKNLPESVKIVRINTNGSKVIAELEELLSQSIRVIVTLSFDGVGNVHDYVRWPVLWENFDTNVKKYIALRERYANLRLNFWTTVSSLNVGDLKNIVDYATQQQIDHAYGFCIRPDVLDIRYENKLTSTAKEFLSKTDSELLNSIANKCCSFKKNNDTELKKFISSQDSLRKIDYKTYFNEVLL
jgi:sulfatase maturation enzyme AslB (radical SAM superfamily)